MEILKGFNVRFYNSNRMYPKNLQEFQDWESDYLKMVINIDRQGCDIGPITPQQAIDNIKFMFNQPEMRWPSANSKCMQITFLDDFLKKGSDDRNKILTNILFAAMKFGKRFGAHGKIY